MGTESELFKDIKKDIVRWGVGSILSIIVASTVFYFKTTYTVEKHEKDIAELKITVSAIEGKINQIMVNPLIQEERYNTIMNTIDEMRKENKESNLRQDKMFDMILDIYKTNKK